MPDASPAPTGLNLNEGLGLTVPWMGAAAGGLGAAAWDYWKNGQRDPNRILRKALTGAATGVGAELGLRAGGELARRHAANGGSGLATALTSTLPALGLGGAGYWLAKERPGKKRDDVEDEA